MDSKLIVENLLKELNIPDDKPFTEWIKQEYALIQNGLNTYFDTLNKQDDDEQITKNRRDFKREIELCEKYNLDRLKLKLNEFGNELNDIVSDFDKNCQVNNNSPDLSEIKANLKSFREKMFPKTCLFSVSKTNDYKLIVICLDSTNDVNLKCLIKSLLK